MTHKTKGVLITIMAAIFQVNCADTVLSTRHSNQTPLLAEDLNASKEICQDLQRNGLDPCDGTSTDQGNNTASGGTGVGASL